MLPNIKAVLREDYKVGKSQGLAKNLTETIALKGMFTQKSNECRPIFTHFSNRKMAYFTQKSKK
jgi:hypothetical protein